VWQHPGSGGPSWDARSARWPAWSPSPARSLTKEETLEFLQDKVAKWWLPDDVVFLEEIPKTSVGKFSKKELRAQFGDYKLPTG
jgi:fatty-acyl-CoA synthase